MPAISSRDFVKGDLVEWIKAFDEADDSAYKTLGVGDIKFQFRNHDTDELSVKLSSTSSKAAFKELPALVQKKVNKVAAAASMLSHELSYEANTGKGLVEGKRNLLYAAIADLLLPWHFATATMTEREESDSKSWIKDNVIAILLDPSSPPQSILEQLMGSTGSFASSLFGNRTPTKGSPSNHEEGDHLPQEHTKVPSLATSASTTPGSKQSSFLFTRYSGIKDLPPGDLQPPAQLTPEGSLQNTESSFQMTPPQSKLKQE